MIAPLSAPVGKNGANKPEEVRLVQGLLNRVLPRLGGSPSRIAVDGICGDETIGAISRFQKARTGTVDGRIDPGGRTLFALLHDARGDDAGRIHEAKVLLDRMAVRCRLARTEGIRPGDLGGPSIDADLRALYRLLAGGPGPDAGTEGALHVGAAPAIPILLFLAFLILVLAFYAAMPRPRGAPVRVDGDEFVEFVKGMGEKVLIVLTVGPEVQREVAVRVQRMLDTRVSEWVEAMEKCWKNHTAEQGGCSFLKARVKAILAEITSKIAFVGIAVSNGRVDVANREIPMILGLLRRAFVALDELGKCLKCWEIQFLS